MNKKIMKLMMFSSLCVSVNTMASEASTKISSGLFYSSGQSQTLGSADSTEFSVPLMISWGQNRWHANVATSYLDVDNKYPTTGRDVKASGIGDTTLSLGYDLTENPWLTAKVKYKFATGNTNKGLSTGKDDVSLQLDYFTPMGRKTSTFATLGYKMPGKVSGASMQNTTYLSVGGGLILSSKSSLGASLDYRQSTYTNLKDQTGVSLFASRKLTSVWSLAGFGSYDSSQTTSLGMTFTRKF